MKNTKRCKHFKDGDCQKSFKDKTFEELVDWIRGELILSLGKGTFKQDVFFYCELVVRWNNSQEEAK